MRDRHGDRPVDRSGDQSVDLSKNAVRLPLDGATVVEVVTGSGAVDVAAADLDGAILVDGLRDGARRTSREGSRLVIHPRRRSDKLRVIVPRGINVTVGTRSGRISVRGPLGQVRASAASGRIQVDGVQQLLARAFSGRIAVRDCAGPVRVATKSGRIEIDGADSARVRVMSGRVVLKRIRGALHARTVSGRIEAQTDGQGDIRIGAISGRVSLRLPPHLRPHVDARSLSGAVRVRLPDGDDLRVAIQTVSGRITVEPGE